MEKQITTDQEIYATSTTDELSFSSAMEGILIVWFYLDNEMTIPKEVNNYAISYSNQQNCIDYIPSNRKEIIFLITSDSSANN